MAGSTSFSSNSASSVSPLSIERIGKVQQTSTSNGSGKLISKKSPSNLHKVTDHQPSAMARKSTVFTIENLLASPCSKNLNLTNATRTNNTSTTTALTGLSNSETHPPQQQQAHQLFASNFFSVISNPHHAIPHINLVDPVAYGYSYLGNYFHQSTAYSAVLIG